MKKIYFSIICSKTNITKKLDKQSKLCYKMIRTYKEDCMKLEDVVDIQYWSST